MKFATISSDALPSLVLDQWGNLESVETRAELIRAEVHSRGSCPRWSALRRIREALGELAHDDDGALDDVCETLEYEGDVTASRGGFLHASPVRAVEVEEGAHRIFTSVPTKVLAREMPGALEVDGVRRLHRFEDTGVTKAALEELGGIVLTAEAWAGLNRTPEADQKWLDQLDERLKWRPESAGSMDGDGRLEWSAFTGSDEGVVWRRGEDAARLWRARTPFGHWVHVWCNDGKPTESEFVMLTMDDANRTRFALCRKNRWPAVATLTSSEVVELSTETWLPYAEYRYLTVRAGSFARRGHVMVWSFSESAVEEVTETIVRRLGMQIVKDGGAKE